jgi:predicted acyl esterase
MMLTALAVITTVGAASAAAHAGRGAASVFPRLHSEYVRMPDGVRLAVDVWLPAGTTAGAHLPAVLEADRSWRAQAYTGGIKNNPNY